MPALKKDLVMFSVGIGRSDHERLAYHGKRMGADRAEIMRAALHDKLNVLDEQESFERANKAARKQRGAVVGAVPEIRGMAPTGMQITLPRAPTLHPEQEEASKGVAKLERSFSMWANHVERAETSVERTIRLQTVYDDMKQRVAPEDAQAGFLKFQDLLKARESIKATKIVTRHPDVPVSGDIEEEV